MIFLQDAHTSEIAPETSNAVVIDMPEHNQGQMGGTMRLGKRQTVFKTQNSVMRQLYGNTVSHGKPLNTRIGN